MAPTRPPLPEALSARLYKVFARPDLSSDPIHSPDFSVNDPTSQDRPLENIYRLFGRDTTLVPFHVGKVAAEGSRRTTTHTESIKPGHQSELRKSSVGVQCGKESRNLYAVQFDGRTDYEAFLLSNPKLHKTLVIESEGLIIIFIRISGAMPPSFRTQAGGWIAEGAIIPVFSRENPGTIKVVSPYPPVELRFSEICWSEDLVMGFMRFATLVTYGEPFVKDKKGNCDLNAMYWANLYYAAIAIRFQPGAKQFLLWEKDRSVKPASEIAVGKMLFEFIVKWRGNGPASSVSQEIVTKCLQTLKMIAVDPNEQATGADHLERFLRDSIEPCAGMDLTSEELFECYRTWSKPPNVIPLAERQFFVTLPGSIAKVFGVGKNHCIQRDGTERRGYSGLRIKGSAVPQDA